MLILGDIEMKLTTKKLKQLIKEEIEAVINETEEGRPGDKNIEESNAASSMEMDIQQLMGMLNISYDEAKEMLLKKSK